MATPERPASGLASSPFEAHGVTHAIHFFLRDGGGSMAVHRPERPVTQSGTLQVAENSSEDKR